MAGVVNQLMSQVVAAIIGGIVALLLAGATWAWTGLWDKFKYQSAALIAEQFEFKVHKSDLKMQDLGQEGYRCPEGQLVSASCIGDNGSPQVAVGPVYSGDGKSFQCMRYGNVPMKVQGIAICATLKK
jgi:hypothetical protein